MMRQPKFLLEPPTPDEMELWETRDVIFEEKIPNRIKRKFFKAFVEGLANGDKTRNLLRKLGDSDGDSYGWTDVTRIYFKDKRLYYIYRHALRLAEGYRQLLREDEADRRAMDGVEEGVWYKGKKVGKQVKYSDNLLKVMLAAGDPDRFSDKRDVRHSGGVSLKLTLSGVRGNREKVVEDVSQRGTAGNRGLLSNSGEGARDGRAAGVAASDSNGEPGDSGDSVDDRPPKSTKKAVDEDVYGGDEKL